MTSVRLTVAVVLFTLGAGIAAPASATPIVDFNDGVGGAAIGAFYAPLGVTFTEGSWGGPEPGNQAGTPSNGLILVGTSSVGWNPPFSPTSIVPISAFFSTPVSMVSLLGVDIGGNGVTLIAYDAEVGGSIVGFDSAVGTEAGVGNFDTLSVVGSNIRRIEVFLNSQDLGDGIFFDNLEFTPTTVPEPSSVLLVGIGVAAVTLRTRFVLRTLRR